ncbi:MAG: CoA transferase [Cypionkella sp.]|uniref:CaiB/BaiF CoA transferase family protein n=1 Tax=Cypionkella sp. TaxID=2811411 RepID=UPI00262E7BB1|nr:CoA transferase [Cypionkella sp.]MDB5657982.1 CoA transferase [Cypionkella sp.]
MTNATSHSDGLLAGYRIVDLSSMLAGPFCGYQLALMGAEVIKVEAPEDGDLARLFGADADLGQQRMGASFLAQNAGKSSIVLNLKDKNDRAILSDLVATADVVLENYRPGVMTRLGFGYDVLQTLRPGIVYCAITGFGATGPLSQRPAYDQIIQGFWGVMDITGTPESGPLRAGFPICDILGGLHGAYAIAAALARREQTGEGARLDVSLMESTMSALAWAASNYLIAGKDPSRFGNDNTAASPSGTFRTADGMINIAANKQQQYEALCHAIKRDDPISDARFALRRDRLTNRAELKAEIEHTLATRGTAEWDTIFAAASVPAGPVLSVPQALSHPHIAARDFVQQFDDMPVPSGRPLSILRGGFQVDGKSPKVDRPPPHLDAQRDEILADLARRQKRVAE